MTMYHVTAERSGKWWVLQAKEAPGAISQVRRLDQANEIREAIAFVAGVPEETVEIIVEPVLPADAVELKQTTAELQEQAAEAAEAASAAWRDLVATLHLREDLSFRDVGTVLGVSHQRAQQLYTEGVLRAWERLADPAKHWLFLHLRQPVPADVWALLVQARVAWWGRAEDDGSHVLFPDAWEFILEHAPASKRQSDFALAADSA